MSTINGGPFTSSRNIDGSAYNPIRTTDDRNVAQSTPVVSIKTLHLTRSNSSTTSIDFGSTSEQLVGTLNSNVNFISSDDVNISGLGTTNVYCFHVIWKFNGDYGSLSGGGLTIIGGTNQNLLWGAGVKNNTNKIQVADSNNETISITAFSKPTAGSLRFQIDLNGSVPTGWGCDIFLFPLDSSLNP